MQNEILVKQNANIDDTINLIVDRVKVDHASEFVNVLCQRLKSGDPDRLAFLKRLFFLVHGTVKFQLDPDGRERVYRPERTISDGVGDCKKMTVIIASALKHCGINCLIKHVYYHSGNMTHVYVIVPYPCTKGYLTIDPVENDLFDSEVQYASARTYDTNGNKMDLYTAGRKLNSSFSSSFGAATAGVMDDIDASAGMNVGASQMERGVLENILVGEPVTISGIGRKQKKTKEQRKENRKKVLKKFSKVGLAAPRLAFLGMVRVNLLKIAHRLAMAWQKDKSAVEKVWTKLGGDITQLKKTIIAGSKENISGNCVNCPEKIGVIAIAAATAAAAPVLIAVVEMLKKLNVKGFTPEDDAKLDDAVEDAETDAADPATTPQTIVNAARGLGADVPPGNDAPETIPPPAPPAATDPQVTPIPDTTPVPTAGGFTINGMSLSDPLVIFDTILKGSFYAGCIYTGTRMIIHNLIAHFIHF